MNRPDCVCFTSVYKFDKHTHATRATAAVAGGGAGGHAVAYHSLSGLIIYIRGPHLHFITLLL